MLITRQVLFSLLGIAAIGWVLATLATPHWQACELILVLGGVALLWESVSSEKQGRKLSRVKLTPPSSGESWFGNTTADRRDIDDLRPWDVEESAQRLAVSRLTIATRRIANDHSSIEQLTNEMLDHAFDRRG